MKYGYIYIIYFTDPRSHLYNHYYIGRKKLHKYESVLDPSGSRYYHGSSSVANREYWPFYSLHEKQILAWAETKEELNNLEINYVSEHLPDPLCININPGGAGGSSKGRTAWNKGKKGIKGHPAWNKGKKCPQISESCKGRKSWNEGLKGTGLPSPIKGKKRIIIDGKIRYI